MRNVHWMVLTSCAALISTASHAADPVVAVQDLAPAAQLCSERYYMTLYGTQSVPLRLRYTHTWATFIRTISTPAGEVVVDVNTVSWLPATLRIRPLALLPERGVNLTLEESFAWAASFGGRTSHWGPYEIDADRYHRFIARKAELDSGAISYRASGAWTKNGPVSNCGQSFARSSPIVGNRYTQPTPSPGENGTSKLAMRYLKVGALAHQGATYGVLLTAIGADRFPSTARQPGEKVRNLR